MQEGDTVPRRDRESVDLNKNQPEYLGRYCREALSRWLYIALSGLVGIKSSAAPQPEDLEPEDPDRREFYAMQHRPTKARNCKLKELL
jgi:hypothetical protein